MNDIKWYEQPVSTLDAEGKPHQWLYKNQPCNVIAMGIEYGKQTPSVMRLQTGEFGVVEVWAAETGEFPDVTYEVYEHHAGHA